MGENEYLTKSSTRFDENKKSVPLHDMSYMERSTPSDIGNIYRNLLGTNSMDRFKNINRMYQEMENMVLEDAPMVILYYDQSVRLLPKNVHGLPSNALNILDLKRVYKN